MAGQRVLYGLQLAVSELLKAEHHSEQVGQNLRRRLLARRLHQLLSLSWQC